MGRPQWMVSAMLGLAMLSACGSASDNDARSAAERFLAATGASQTAEACELLAPRALADLQGQCDQQLAESEITPSPVSSVEAWGDNAIAHTNSGAVFLHRFDQGWLVTGAGCQPQADQPYECAVGGP
jgi:hypothetical protein